MSTGSGLRGFTDKLIQAQVHRKRDRFLASISKKRVLGLVSSRRQDRRCDYFKDPKRGSYNICYFVEFEDGERWVLRVPIAPCLAFGARRKLESEVATMQLVAEKTDIPLPKIIAYELGNDTDPLSSFMILEYIDGQPVLPHQLGTLPQDQRARFYTSLADVYIQLRRLTFPMTGSLTRQQGGGFAVRQALATIDLNRQELEGFQPSDIQAAQNPNAIFSSANEYTAMLLQLAANAFNNSRSIISSQEQGEDALYHQDLFRRFATEQWLDRGADAGPFVLVHGDLQPFNILVDKNMEIVSVLDWEWSRVAPCQYFLPPLWLTNIDTTVLAWEFAYNHYLERFKDFLAIVEGREKERCGDTLLSAEWSKAKRDGGFLVANALENCTDMDWFANRFIGWRWYGGKEDVAERISAFIRQDPARGQMVHDRVLAYEAYQAELRHESSKDVVPTFCLYKRLALALQKYLVSITSVTLGSLILSMAYYIRQQ
ncbi:hypothetical protein N0V84_005045 [Fusarium piperis]|uniref:Aminoglycoside phosphotransferase domain-containing protein n=1 Tax=Fusarium piperis TaxID=1435070 RepID=A0A9W9BQM9_9HYPO|nr:hypothetical protein N0V84_005045 [Fusarium piperis]